jgi:spoIIIJ-associated protein
MAPRLSIEVEGKSIAEAVKKGLRIIKLSRDKVSIEVLSEEKKGLFGMAGAKLAKVRLSVTPSKENT